MNYYIDIVDTQNSDYTTALENASKNNIVLSYQGKDELDELVLVGSTLRFNMEVPHNNNTDAAFIDLFTADEQRFRVDLKHETDNRLIWQGFLLPDSYSEPYKGGNYFVDFEATDGLGRLRGKYLPDEYYQKEKSVVDIITTCLALTGLQFDLVIAPGIDNRLEKDWNKIYLYGLNLVEGDKQKDAYTILFDIVQDTVSRCYQHLGVWYIEGLNKAGQLTYSAHKYDYEGNLIGTPDVNKVEKTVSNKQLLTPNVVMQAPYKKVAVEHNRVPLTLPDTIAEEQNDGWVKAAGVDETIYCTHWFGHGAYLAKAYAPDYYLYLDNNNNAALDETKYISLLKKIYVAQNTKLKFKASFKADSGNTQYVNSWRNKLRFAITLNGEDLHTNLGTDIPENTDIQFNSDKEATLNFDFLVTENGLLDIKIWQVYGTNASTQLRGIWVEQLELLEINPATTLTYTETIAENYTQEKDLALTFADDATGLSSAFTLAKIHEPNINLFNTVQVDIIDYIFQNGNHYAIVDLPGANVIKDNINAVWYSGDIIPVIDVIYNYRGGEQMAVQTETEYSTGFFIVFRFATIQHTLDRTHWQQWTDSVYNVQVKRYGDAVAGLFKNLFKLPRVKADFTASKLPILFGDIIKWNYIADRYYTPINIALNFDTGNTVVTMVESVYISESSLLPPYVDCGPTIYIGEVQTSALINATASDPDGTIVSYLWEKISGDAGEVINFPNSEDTTIDNLTGDEYTFQLTVTDNDGLTASDTVDIIRIVNYQIAWTNTFYQQDLGGPTFFKYWRYRLDVTPELLANLAITNSISIYMFTGVTTPGFQIPGAATSTIHRVELYKNGILYETFLQSHEQDVADGVNVSFTDNLNTTINYIEGDVIRIEVTMQYYNVLNASFDLDVSIDTATIEDYPGVVTNTPAAIQLNWN